VSVVLGLNEMFHDTAAALVVDGSLAALMEEERLSRRKHAMGFALLGGPPSQAIDWCLARAGVRPTDVDAIAVSFEADALGAVKMLWDITRGNLKRSSLRNTMTQRLELSDPAINFVGGLTLGMARRWRFLRRLSATCRAPIQVVNHHLAHAASAYFPSGEERSGIVVLDGMGDASPTTIWEGRDQRLLLREMYEDPHDSLGILYRTVSLALGFSFMDAGKTMGLAAYGTPRAPFSSMLRLQPHRYLVDWSVVKSMTGRHARFSGELQQVHRDMAASLQRGLEEVGVMLARRCRELAGSRNLCLAGGVALNCNMNSRILHEGDATRVFVQPGAMDMGCALGAALVVASRLGDRLDRGFSVYTGPAYRDDEIETALAAAGLRYRRVEDPAHEAARLLEQDLVIGWFQGAMEFGPRALGARSILGRPDRVETRDRVNRIKQREPWRPLAPAVLEDELHRWVSEAVPSPYMTFTFKFRPEQAPRVPAVVHHDQSARIQSVSAAEAPLFHRLIQRFFHRTGLPLVLNTSFNARGEPIVCSPADAARSFTRLGLDALVAGSLVVDNQEQIP